MAWTTAAEWRARLAAESIGTSTSDEEPKDLGDRLLWLGRFGLTEDLQRQASLLRASPDWNVDQALRLSLSWLLAGDGLAADLAFLEADQLEPSLALVPDLWGLWPTPSATRPLPEQMDVANRFRTWRWLEPQAHWRVLLSMLQADWHYALTPDGLDRMVLALRHSAGLEPPIEPLLAALVDESVINENPAEAGQFWGLLADVCPSWDYARIKAADLALAVSEPERASAWLEEAGEELRRNHWFWDISARHALDTGAIGKALDHWNQSISLAPPDEAELFRQRRREARRGPGVLQAHLLLSGGEIDDCLPLLRSLVDEDPQWQPLRSLLEQAEAAARSAATAPSGPTSASTDASGFAQLLDRTAARLGVPLPESTKPTSHVDPEAGLQQATAALEAFARFLSDAEALFALKA